MYIPKAEVDIVEGGSRSVEWILPEGMKDIPDSKSYSGYILSGVLDRYLTLNCVHHVGLICYFSYDM